MNVGARTPDASTGVTTKARHGALREYSVVAAELLGKRYGQRRLGAKVMAGSGHAAACLWGRETLTVPGARGVCTVTRSGSRHRDYLVIAVLRTKHERGPFTCPSDGCERHVVWRAGDLLCVAREVVRGR